MRPLGVVVWARLLSLPSCHHFFKLLNPNSQASITDYPKSWKEFKLVSRENQRIGAEWAKRMVLRVQSKRIVVLRRPILQIFCGFFQACKMRGEPKEFWLSLACEDNKTPDASSCWKSSKKSKGSLERRAASQELQSEEPGNVCICVYVPLRLKAPVTSKMLWWKTPQLEADPDGVLNCEEGFWRNWKKEF